MNNSIGLTDQQAKENNKKYGLNVLVQRGTFHLFVDFLKSLASPLLLLLLGASFISAVSGDVKDFFIIVSIVIVSSVITFYQHFKAEKAAAALKQKVILTATIIRDGIKKEIPFSYITIGDIVLLSAGDIVPADGILLEAKNLSIDESMLTGESFPADKDSNSEENKNMFSGTHVVNGEGKAQITKIGAETAMGKLSQEIQSAKPATAFDKGVNDFSYLVLKAVLALSVVVFLTNAIIRHDVLGSLLFAVALAVGITPELLPLILTINLSEGALRMEKKDVIVKYLPSIQNFGSMNILCTDKTGTLTENNITLHSYENFIGKTDESILSFGMLNSYFQAGFRNPLDDALLHLKFSAPFNTYEKIDEIPFDFERKRLSVIVKDKNSKKNYIIVKGAPQKIFEKISHYINGEKTTILTSVAKEKLQKKFEELSKQGLRVIAIAKKEIESKKTYVVSDEKDLVFLGFITFSDPVKKTAEHTVKELEKLGIIIKILTGDNELVTKKVCLDAKINVENILLGPEVENLDMQTLAEKAQNTTIFAHLTPSQKAKVIDALQLKGYVVGYLGDGVNDAPPLKSSDVGISVNNGSDIARDVADIVLMRKSLSVLKDGVIEGRITHSNILKYIMMELSSNFGNMVTVAISSFFLPFLPILPVQILLNNFLYDFSQITIPSDNVDKDLISTPRKWDIKFINKFMLVFGPISSLFDFLTFFILLFILHATVPMFRTGWFIESLVTQTIIIFSIRTKKIPFFKSLPSIYIVFSTLIVIVVGLGIVISPLRSYFNFVSLPYLFYPLLGVIIICYFTMVESAKILFYKKIYS